MKNQEVPKIIKQWFEKNDYGDLLSILRRFDLSYHNDNEIYDWVSSLKTLYKYREAQMIIAEMKIRKSKVIK